MSSLIADPKPAKKVEPSARKAAARPKPLFDYDSPEFTEALSRHFHAAKRAALSRKDKVGTRPSVRKKVEFSNGGGGSETAARAAVVAVQVAAAEATAALKRARIVGPASTLPTCEIRLMPTPRSKAAK